MEARRRLGDHTGLSNQGQGIGRTAVHFKRLTNTNCKLVTPPPIRLTVNDEPQKTASYDMLDELFH